MGVTTCKILSELPPPAPGAAGPAGPTAGPAVGADGLSPLAACVLPHPNVQGAAALASHLFGSWWLAPDRHAALAAVRADRRRGGRRRNIVTSQVRSAGGRTLPSRGIAAWRVVAM